MRLASARKLDELGRICLPKGLRTTLDINEKDDVEIYVHGESIVLQKYEPGCTFCGCMDGLSPWKGKYVCDGCRDGMKAG